jgi:hypothetical protein
MIFGTEIEEVIGDLRELHDEALYAVYVFLT